MGLNSSVEAPLVDRSIFNCAKWGKRILTTAACVKLAPVGLAVIEGVTDTDVLLPVFSTWSPGSLTQGVIHLAVAKTLGHLQQDYSPASAGLEISAEQS